MCIDGDRLVHRRSLGYLLSNHNKADIDTSVHQHTDTSDRDQIYTCSMHPQIRSTTPGNCPICGMELIPLEGETGDLDPLAVEMSPTAMQLARVQTMTVGHGNAKKEIRLSGKVQADERLRFTQSSHIPGRIEKLEVNFTGEYVHGGQVLAYLYSPELVTAQEELIEAQKLSDTQPALFNAAKNKLKNWKLTENQINQIITSGEAMEHFPILANVSGYVTEKMVNLGDYVKQGAPIYEIADLTRVWVLFDVYESDLAWIRKGAAISYTVQSLPGQKFSGNISYIDPVIDPNTRVAKARVVENNNDLELKPEMFATGTVAGGMDMAEQSITIPKTAVMWTGIQSVVYVMQTSSEGVGFMMREVTLGPELGETYVIESGLVPGEEIAVNGTFSIDAAAQLAGKPSMMNRNPEVSASEQVEAIDSASLQLLVPLFQEYFDAKNALVDDDFDAALANFIQMKAAFATAWSVAEETMPTSAHQLWKQPSSALKTSMEHIAHAGDIEILRSKFIDISNAMIAIANAFDPLPQEVYVQHCPMANSDKGADWLSTKKEILNPYFGKSMLSCGETTRTIK
ncbi:MAG: efflux RND transporter periplasmic adaptor subunit [Cyclobacteriaceae bacterium]|nr:efflux RND transporter periplasmic adaptor subunit [Cyclobacteriaceae bacterium]